MKRLQAGILALLLCIALALPGCGGTQLQETIPTMNLVSGSRKAVIPKFGYSWNYKGQGEVADPIHPLDAAASPDLLPTVGAAAGHGTGHGIFSAAGQRFRYLLAGIGERAGL